MHDGIVDHLPVDLDGRGPASLGLAEGRDDAPCGVDLLRARQVGLVHRRNLVRVHAAAALEAAAPAALERAPERLALLEVEPRTVYRRFPPGCSRGEYQPRTRFGKLGLVECRRERQVVGIVA